MYCPRIMGSVAVLKRRNERSAAGRKLKRGKNVALGLEAWVCFSWALWSWVSTPGVWEWHSLEVFPEPLDLAKDSSVLLYPFCNVLPVICHMESILDMTLSPLDYQFLQSNSVWGSTHWGLGEAITSIKSDWSSRSPSIPVSAACPHLLLTFCPLIPPNYNDFLCINGYRITFLYCLSLGYLF